MKLSKYQLGEVASYEVSNIDKKSKDGEKIVRLCNFTDVYSNWAITDSMKNKFMEASASDSQIEKFSLKKGQVAITKDSETRDDIGIPTYIADDFKDVVLGYHCALITPDSTKVDGKYLNAFLNSNVAKKYFENNAVGSGMRFSLTLDTIKDILLYLPSLKDQKEIGNLFSLIDKKISLNQEINRNLEALARQLYDYWFVQFDFRDENGRPYKSSGGKMVWNEKLKREIPEGWQIVSVNEVSESQRGVSFDKSDTTEVGIQVLRGNNIENNHYVEDSNIVIIPKKLVNENQKIKTHDIIMTMSSGSKEHVGKCMQFQFDSPHTFGAFLNRFRPLCHPHYLFLFLTSQLFKLKIRSLCNGTGINNLTYQNFHDIMLPLAPPSVMIKFDEMICATFDQIGKNELEINHLNQQRNELLPLLMNGQVSIKLTGN